MQDEDDRGAERRGQGSSRPRTWTRTLTYLAISLAAALGAVLVLHVADHALRASSGMDLFHVDCTLLALAALVGAIGVAVFNGICIVRRRFGRNRVTHPLLMMCLGVFGIVLFTVGWFTVRPPSARPADSLVWAGYETTRDGITRVTATWNQPGVTPRSSGLNDVVFWVGLTGGESNTVEQIGTEGDCRSGTPARYDAWYELFPEPLMRTGLAIRPGDTVTATVVGLGHNRFSLTLANHATGARFATTQVAGNVGNTHGAIIVEESRESDVGLAGFDPVRFSRCAFNGKPVAAFRLTSFDIAPTHGVAETTTSEVSTDGAGFTVARR